MDLNIFKRKLDAYGADFSRWEGADAGAARVFMATSGEAQALYARAEKLDRMLDAFEVAPPAHAIMGAVNSRISGARVAPFPLRIETPPWKVAVGMGMIAGAVVMLFVFSTMPPAPFVQETGAKIAVLDSGQEQVDAFISEMASLMDEDVQADEILEAIEVAQGLPASSGESDVDDFLDELYDAGESSETEAARSETATDAATDQDIWEMLYPGTDAP